MSRRSGQRSPGEYTVRRPQDVGHSLRAIRSAPDLHAWLSHRAIVRAVGTSHQTP